MIVDDHTLFAEAIQMSLEDAGVDVVASVTTADAAIAAARTTAPDVVVMDIGLPDQSGLAAGRTILDERSDAKILALTALNDRATVDEALRIGFRGYLTKDTPVEQFTNAIQAVMDGQLVLPYRLAPARRTADSAAVLFEQLTARERQVLELLVQGAAGRTIATTLAINNNTVRTHIQSILTKLQVHSRLEAAAFAVRHRLVQTPHAAEAGADPSLIHSS
jgi:two-component system nitrate/nitrite response regulator NarL